MIRLEGAERLIGRIGRLEREISSGRLLSAAADVYADAIRRAAPYRTGQLRGSITTQTLEGGAVAVGPDRRDGFYGWFLEAGTARIPARPWFEPAVAAARPAADRAMARQFVAEMRRVFR